MRRIFIALIFMGTSLAVLAADAAAGKVVKVLPFLMDAQGRVARTPSLFDRDAYQAWLHEHTNEVSGIRYDVLWSAAPAAGEKLTVRLELRAAGEGNNTQLKTIESEVASTSSSHWTELKLAGEDYKKLGTVTAWRASLWAGKQQLGEQQSFLW